MRLCFGQTNLCKSNVLTFESRSQVVSGTSFVEEQRPPGVCYWVKNILHVFFSLPQYTLASGTSLCSHRSGPFFFVSTLFFALKSNAIIVQTTILSAYF